MRVSRSSWKVKLALVGQWVIVMPRSIGFLNATGLFGMLLSTSASAQWDAGATQHLGMVYSQEGVRRQIEAAAGGARSRESADQLELRRRAYGLMAATLTRENARVRAAGTPRVAAFTDTVRQDFKRISNNDLAEFTLTADGFEER